MRAVKSGSIVMVVMRGIFGGQEPWRPKGCINLGQFTVKNRDLLKGKGAEMAREWVSVRCAPLFGSCTYADPLRATAHGPGLFEGP